MSNMRPLQLWELESDRETDPVRLQELLKKEDQWNLDKEKNYEAIRQYQLEHPVTRRPGESSKSSRKTTAFPKDFIFRKNLRLQSAGKKYTVQKDPNKGHYMWTPPRKGSYKLNVDGSKRNMSGGYGAILRDDVGNAIAAAAGVSEPVSTLFHQLQGVEKGLQLAANCGCRSVRVEVPLAYTVYVVDGTQMLLKEDCIPMVLEILARIESLMSKIWFCTIDSCPKETNKVAEYLSKLHRIVEFDVGELPQELDVIVKGEAGNSGFWLC